MTPMAAPSESHLLGLNCAVMEIRQACDELSDAAQRSPFFFIVGAGISHPSGASAITPIERFSEHSGGRPVVCPWDRSPYERGFGHAPRAA